MGADAGDGAGQRLNWEGMPAYGPTTTDGRIVVGSMGDKGVAWGQPGGNMFPIPQGGPSPPEPYSASNGSVETNNSPLTAYGVPGSTGKVSTSFLDYLEPPLSILDGPQGQFNGRHRHHQGEGSTPDGFRPVYNDPIELNYLSEHEARHLFTQ